jgi:signal transduction histidine kinase/DNA-binding response OmpR family regulator
MAFAVNKDKITKPEGLRTTLVPAHKEELRKRFELLHNAKNAIDSANAYTSISHLHIKTTYYLKTPPYDSILYYSDKIIALTENKKSKTSFQQYLKAIALKGVAYKDLGNLSKSLDYFKIIIRETEHVSNPNHFYLERQNATTLIAGVYAIQKNFELALKQYDDLFKYIERNKVDTTLVSSIVHLRYTRFSRELKNMEVALQHAKKALQIARINKFSVREAMVFLEMAHIYVDTDQIKQADTYLEKAIKILSSDAKYMNLRSKYYYLKAVINDKTNNTSEKIRNAEKAFALLSKRHITNWHIDTANLLYDAYKDKGFYKKANEILEEIVSLEKLVANKEELKKTSLFAIERSDENIALAEAKNKTMNQVVLCVIFLLIITCISALYIYKDRRKKIQFAREISKKNEQLELLDKAKSDFFSNITHELQTPLTLIQGPLEQTLGEHGEKLDTITKSKLQMAMKNTSSLKALVNDILNLSKLKAKKLRLHNQSTDLDTFLNTIFRKFMPLMQQKKIHFHYCCKDLENYYAITDRKKLEKILNNLLSNAIKYTPAAGTVTVCGKLTKKDALVISIEDTGVGILTADIPHIFDRYFQSKDSSKPLEGGYGIGLSLVKELVELMKGNISVHSEAQKGSQFTVSIPLKNVHKKAQKAYLNSTTNEVIAPLADFTTTAHLSKTIKQYTVLIVEDHQDMQHFIASILQKNYQLLIANNGKEALEKLKHSSVDLIISDVMMPAMDGFTLLETLKKSTSYSNIPMIMLTALSDISYKLKALTIGVDDYLSKPFMATELVARTHNLIQRYQSRKEFVTEHRETVEDKEEVATVFTQQTELPTIIEKSDTELIAKVGEIIEQNMDNPDFKLNDLPEKVYLSERQLRRKIKLITGLSPKKFQQEIQLLKARKLLEEGVYTNVKAVVISVGMQNTTRFSKLYVQRFGKHPTSYFAT